jgi:hypothetical protein
MTRATVAVGGRVLRVGARNGIGGRLPIVIYLMAHEQEMRWKSVVRFVWKLWYV